jgi:hypothetical protein
VPNADIKTKANDASVEAFLRRVPDAARRADALDVLQMLKDVTRLAPKMWGASIVGFGSYHYTYASGREGDMCLIGFSPRAQALTLYIMPGFRAYEGLLKRLGKCKTSVSCLYIRRLADVDRTVLRQLMTEAYRHMRSTHAQPRRRGAAASRPKT